jgi:hypothetical protein
MKDKYKDAPPFNPSPKELILALLNYPEFLKILQGTKKESDMLLDWLITHAWMMDDENVPLPNITGISKELKIDPKKIRLRLSQLIEEILDLNEKRPELFCKPHQIRCHIRCRYVAWYASMYIGLDILPRIGEHFDFAFFRAVNGGSMFQVYNIYHHYQKEGQLVDIQLTSNTQNSYFRLLKDKAYLNREISYWDYVDPDNEDDLYRQLTSNSRAL